ncbi:WAT1-related protein [Vigna angularis]|uniref:WAT1-related protein n=2 Tax=Phaseolus angularis TaxID=3914 RepID=A0A8T0KN37_PHAAN|nr:WAT1-related protein At3g30340 [Vigna angularis]KAG2401096.1 WAT1-related protein [Vigna angularis]
MFVPLFWETVEFLYILEKTAVITPFFKNFTNNKVQQINFMMLTHCHELFKPVSIMILVNLALAFVNLLMKKVLNEGTDYMSIITYRQAISFIFMAPIAFIYERKHKVEVRIIFLLFLSALLGVTVPQNLFLLGLEYTSATFSCAFLNMVPVFTFIMAVPFGIEKVNVQSKGGKAKVMGTFVCIGGALLLVLYKGMPLIKPQSQYIADKVTSVPSTAKLETWIIGSIILTVSCLLWSSWFIIQAKISKKYPCQYSCTAILSLFAAIQSAILTLIIKRNNASWILKGKLEIISIIYAGLVGSGLCYVAMSWCVKQSGPVFTAAFTPLIQIFVAILDFSVLKEEIYLGSVAGSALVIAGMYILLWGKSKEQGQDVQKDTQTNQDVERQ